MTNCDKGSTTSSNPLVTGQFSLNVAPFEYKFYLDPENLAHLRLRLRETTNENKFSPDDLRALEQYFSQFVASTHNSNAVQSFIRLMIFSYKAHSGMLKSVLCLIKHQLNTHPDQGVPWRASLCLTTPPPNAMTPPVHYLTPNSPIAPGSVAIISTPQGSKLLFWIKLTSVSNPENQVIFPLRYDGELNEIQVFVSNPGLLAQQQQQQPNNPQVALINNVNAILKRQTTAYQAVNECCMWPAIRDLFQNLQLPSAT